jgi:hypothetical protein
MAQSLPPFTIPFKELKLKLKFYSMDNRDSNRVNMIRVTLQYCTDNTSATSGIPAFAPLLATAVNKLLLIDQLDQVAIATTGGVTLDTSNLRLAMMSLALKCSGAVVAYATAVNNNTLKAKVNFTDSDLKRIKKEEVDDVCQTIHDETNANISNAQNYGITPSDVTSLQTAINLYRTSVQNPRQALITKNDAKRQIKVLIDEIIKIIFKNQMDKMINTLKLSNPNFVNKYFEARVIIDLGKTTGKIRGTITDESKNKLADVSIKLRLTGETPVIHQTLSTPEGTFGIANIKPGNYDIEVSKSGFQTITETKVRFGPGKELQRRYTLTAVS